MGDALKNGIDFLFQPTLYFFGTVAMLAAVLIFRKQAAKKIWMVLFFGLGTLFMIWAVDDPDFRTIITKPDNVPIVILIASVVFFTWLAIRQAVINDERMERGEPSIESELGKKKVFTWPDLVYVEFICLVLFTAFLIIWSLKVQAPIEEPAATARTPNPSKAPWYFLGLQEMLVYFDPWIAGVVLPGFIIVGLCAIPFVDTNPKGNGYYTFNERKFAWSFFMAGFLLFWISFVILGTFLRGPNWSFFGPFEFWDLHKLEPLVNVDLSTYFWNLVGQPKPANPLMRESPGIVALLGFFVVVPPLLAKTMLKGMVQKMGMVRYNVFMHLMLWFALLPIKMLLRWVFNLKYIVGIPEWFFNV